jgi:glycosyltransferase involved in cell wall biosynthesis
VRVLFNTYPWAFATPGGGELQLLKYAEYLPAHGVKVVRHDLWKPVFDTVDVVHFFSCIEGSLQFCRYVKSRGLPLVISSSLWITEETSRQYPMHEIRKQLALADLVITNSVIEADTIARVLALPRERFVPVMNGADAQFSSIPDPSLFREQYRIDRAFVLNVANIEKRKNQLNLVRAMGDHGPLLVVIGHIRDADYAKQVFSEAGTRLRYLGPLDHHDPLLAAAYAACSVFALPSTLETPGLAALEAAAVGAPIVVTSEGSTQEYFGDLAFYVDHNNPEDIRLKIEQAIQTGRNSALRNHVITRFTWPAAAAVLTNHYRTAICGRQRIE